MRLRTLKTPLLATVATICLGAPLANSAVGAERPNIILLMGDDHGWDEVGYNGHPHVKTPTLDEMAASGLKLNRFFSAHPSCSPTRGSIITGRHPNRYGTFTPNCSIRPEEISIAQLLAKTGYRCGHFGKWHLGPVKSASPTNPGAFGFHEWLSHDNFFELDPVLSHNGQPPQKRPGESSQVIIDEAIRFIEKSNSQQEPFFAVVWFGSPHEPYSGLPDDLALYDDLPQRFPKPLVRLTSMKTGLPVRRPLGDVLRERYAEITAMDRSIGKLRAFLRESKLRDNTLLWYCGDNGVPMSGRLSTPFRGQKGLVYDGGVRVPGVIEWPAKIREPRQTDFDSVTTDTLPTLCELSGAALPKRPLDGVSLTALLNGVVKDRPEPIFFWSYAAPAPANRKPYIAAVLQEGTTPLVKKMAGKYTRTFRNFHHDKVRDLDYHGPRAMLHNQYKLVIHSSAGKKASVELFDVRQDPSESKNLAQEKPATVSSMQRAMRKWQTSVLNSLTGADYRSTASRTE